MLSLGIFTVSAFGQALPDEPSKELSHDDFLVQHYWRVVWGFPIVVAAAQMILMTAFFTFTVPQEYQALGDSENLKKLFSRLYTTD